MRGSPRVLLIDNIDSFTFNVADLVHRVTGVAPTVWRHDHDVVGRRSGPDERGAPGDDAPKWWQNFDAIVVGPGPGSPMVDTDMGISRQALSQRDVPVLGVCLGHQGIAYEAGHVVAAMADPMHGRVSLVTHAGTGLFAGIPSPFEVVRYHSLAVDLAAFTGAGGDGAARLAGCAWAADDGALMAIEDPGGRRWGVQFHPESVLTEHGARLITNFFAEAGVAIPPVAATDSAEVGANKASGSTATGGDWSSTAREAAQGAGAVATGLMARKLDGHVDPWALHEALAQRRSDNLRSDEAHESMWLDSSDQAGISVFADATGPAAYTVVHRVGHGSDLSTGEHLAGVLMDNLDVLAARINYTDGSELDLPFDFRPGFGGYFGYELKAETGGRAAHRSPRPDAWLIFADRAVVIDHLSEAVYLLALHTPDTRAEQERWCGQVSAVIAALQMEGARSVVPATPAVSRTPVSPTAPVPLGHNDDIVAASGRHTRPEYEALIARAQDLIRAGETYEVCLTNEVTWPERVDEKRAYAALRSISPVPHGAWLQCGSFSVLSASPERFVSLSATGTVRAEPIKGTRARAVDSALDAAMVAELAADPKERAENLMIVDLLRNDLHRVCRAGTVEVTELFTVRTWSTVHQLVSTITGQVADGVGPTQVLRAAFPGGSMTGAPKVRTMEIMDELEAGPRGVYSGAIGWIGVNGAMDTSIVIRTVVLGETSETGETGESDMGRRTATFGIGGAVTVLSRAGDEYVETLIKSRGVASALVEAAR